MALGGFRAVDRLKGEDVEYPTDYHPELLTRGPLVWSAESLPASPFSSTRRAPGTCSAASATRPSVSAGLMARSR